MGCRSRTARSRSSCAATDEQGGSGVAFVRLSNDPEVDAAGMLATGSTWPGTDSVAWSVVDGQVVVPPATPNAEADEEAEEDAAVPRRPRRRAWRRSSRAHAPSMSSGVMSRATGARPSRSTSGTPRRGPSRRRRARRPGRRRERRSRPARLGHPMARVARRRPAPRRPPRHLRRHRLGHPHRHPPSSGTGTHADRVAALIGCAVGATLCCA